VIVWMLAALAVGWDAFMAGRGAVIDRLAA